MRLAITAATGQLGREVVSSLLDGPEPLTTAELCALISETTGRQVMHRDATIQDYVDACMAGGMSEQEARFLVTLYAPVPLGLNGIRTDHIEHLTGIPPKGLSALIRERYPEGGWS